MKRNQASQIVWTSHTQYRFAAVYVHISFLCRFVSKGKRDNVYMYIVYFVARKIKIGML